MSSAIAGAAGYPSLARLIQGSHQIRQHFDMLTEQANTGLIATTWSGLNGTAPVALRLGPQVASLHAVQSNIGAASGPLAVTQSAMKQIQSIAADLLAQMPNLNGLNASEVDAVAGKARGDLAALAGLLDSKYGDVYVFAGQDSANPPVPNPDQIVSSGFFTGIATAVGGLTVNGAAATAAATLALAGSNTVGTSPFSSYLSAPAAGLSPPAVATGEGQSRTIGLLASANTDAISSGSSTTGSYMRDLMRALATVGSMSAGQVNDPNFGSLVSDTQTSVAGAISAMSTDVGILGEQQSSLQTIKTALSDTATALTGQVSSAQDVDMAATLSALTATQTQLQASYQLIQAANGMSLVKFLPAG